jgi:general secretion pathway protein K
MLRNGHIKQSGAAIVTALLVVMLAATIASYLLAQQAEALTRVERTNERVQLGLYARPTIDWARDELMTLQRRSPNVVHTGQAWAQQLVARPIENAVASGLIRDAQGLFNLNNIVDAADKQREADMLALKALLKALDLDESLALNIADWIDKDEDTSGPGSAESGFYSAQTTPYRAANRKLVNIEELYRVKGIDATIMRRLAPFVTALPFPKGEVRTRVNINTAPREVLQAMYRDSPKEAIDELLQLRDVPITDAESLSAIKSLKRQTAAELVGVNSRYFQATFSITGQRTQVRQAALLELQPPAGGQTAWPTVIWVREL